MTFVCGRAYRLDCSEQGRNPVLAGRGSDRLESVGGIWGEEIAGETRQLIRVKWWQDVGESRAEKQIARSVPLRRSPPRGQPRACPTKSSFEVKGN